MLQWPDSTVSLQGIMLNRPCVDRTVLIVSLHRRVSEAGLAWAVDELSFHRFYLRRCDESWNMDVCLSSAGFSTTSALYRFLWRPLTSI